MKKPAIFLMALLCAGTAFGGAIYGPVEFLGDVSVGSWTNVADAWASWTTGGVYTNGAYTNYYRLTCTNEYGRTPTTTNMCWTWSGTADASNALVIAWQLPRGVDGLLVERSLDGGTTWTNYLAVGMLSTNWTDWGTNTWTAGSVTGLYSAISAPSVPWGTSGDVSGLLASNVERMAEISVLQTGKADVVHTHVWEDITDGGTVSQQVVAAADALAEARDTILSSNVLDAAIDMTNELDLTITERGYLTNETDTLETVTARGATTPTAITVSNDVTVGTGHFVYSPLFRSYSGTSWGSPVCWTSAQYRYEFGMCPEMQAFVFNPIASATNAAAHYPLVIVATPGKRTSYNMYSEALRVETNGNVTLGGQLDMCGYSIVNIGTNSLHFSDGTSISSDTWQGVTSARRRAEGPAAALAVYLAGWLAGKRKRAKKWLQTLSRILRLAPALLVVLAGSALAEDLTSTRMLFWDTGAAAGTNAQARVAAVETGKADVVHTHAWANLTDGGAVSQNIATAADSAAASRDAAVVSLVSTGAWQVSGEWLMENLQVPVVTNAQVVSGTSAWGRILVKQSGATAVNPADALGWYSYKGGEQKEGLSELTYSPVFTNAYGFEIFGNTYEFILSKEFSAMEPICWQGDSLLSFAPYAGSVTGSLAVLRYPFFGCSGAETGVVSASFVVGAWDFDASGFGWQKHESLMKFRPYSGRWVYATEPSEPEFTNTVLGVAASNVLGTYADTVDGSTTFVVTNVPTYGVYYTYTSVPVTNWVSVRDYLTNLVERVEALE